MARPDGQLPTFSFGSGQLHRDGRDGSPGSGEDVGGGLNAFRLIKHWLGALAENDVVVRRAYDRLKPALGAALEQIPSLYYFEGD